MQKTPSLTRQPLAGARPRLNFRSQRKLRLCCAANTVPALKAWAPVCSALGDGLQTVLLRKGGIREPTFTPKFPAFLLLGTGYHTNSLLLKEEDQDRYQKECESDPKTQPTLVFDCVAEITGAWATTDPAVLMALEPLHIYGPDFLEARFGWRPTQPLTVMELRAYKLKKPVVVDTKDEFWGCFSWVDVETGDTSNGNGDGNGGSLEELKKISTPALDNIDFAEKQKICRQGLSKLQDLKEIKYNSQNLKS